MNYLISFSQSSLPSGTCKISFEDGIVTDSAGTEYNLSGSNPSVESINIMASAATVLHTIGDTSSLINLPANRYVYIRTTIETMKIVSTATYNLWFVASTEATGSPEVT